MFCISDLNQTYTENNFVKFISHQKMHYVLVYYVAFVMLDNVTQQDVFSIITENGFIFTTTHFVPCCKFVKPKTGNLISLYTVLNVCVCHEI